MAINKVKWRFHQNCMEHLLTSRICLRLWEFNSSRYSPSPQECVVLSEVVFPNDSLKTHLWSWWNSLGKFTDGKKRIIFSSFFFLNNFGHMKQLEGLQFPDQRQNPVIAVKCQILTTRPPGILSCFLIFSKRCWEMCSSGWPSFWDCFNPYFVTC